MPKTAQKPEDSAPNEILAAREVALELLTDVVGRGQSLDVMLERSDRFRALPARDRGFCRMLVSTTLRRLGQIDDLIHRNEERPSKGGGGSRNAGLQNILRLAVTQIVFMDVPDHAAVDTSVRLAGAHQYERQKGFVNALLRNIAGNWSEVIKRQDPARLNTPEWMLKCWIADYELRAAAEIATANLAEAALDITVKSEDDRNYLASEMKAVELSTGTLRLMGGGSVSELPGFKDGTWWVQDAAAAIPAKLFGDINGEHVIDLCAAPGGKTMQLAAQGARVTALDRSAQRLKRLEENLERLKLAENVEVIASDATTWRPANGEAGRILLDAPCTATGTIRRHPDVLHLKTEKDMESLRAVQANILQNAFDMMMPGGVLVYCTCSLQKAEGEEQIERLLAENPNAARVPIQAAEIGDYEELLTEEGDIRILPFHLAAQGGMDGFYVARLTKTA